MRIFLIVLHINRFFELLRVVGTGLCPQRLAILTSCSNIWLRLPRVRGLSASMVDKANFLTKEHSYV